MGIVATVPVEEVDNGPVGAGVFIWFNDDAFDVFVHGGAVDQDGICFAGKGAARQKQ